MKFEELIILLPCHSLEDFPLHHTGDDAESLLSCWSAMWHPAVLASAGKMPSWRRVESPPESLTGRLLVVPQISEAQLPTGLAQRAAEEKGCLVRRTIKRDEAIAAVLAGLGEDGAKCNDEVVGDFLALGYCYLQVELLTRQMRYSSSLDQVFFEMTLLAGAQAAAVGNETLAREKLQACFDLLAEERGRYYPVDAYLVDLTLVASTTLGASLRRELAATTPGNFVLSGETLEEMAAMAPASLDALREALAQKRVSLVGGEDREGRLALLSAEDVLAGLTRGLAIYDKLLGARPTVFGRRRFGYSPLLPQLLSGLGFRGAVLSGFDGQGTPTVAQSKIRWQGAGAEAIDALARAPRDAADPATFLNLAIKIGEAMDADHVATQVLAHWPGLTAPWHDDLRRIARYGKALGRFVTLEEYFASTTAPGQSETFTADQYVSPYLKEAVVRGASRIVSGPQDYWRRSGQAAAAHACGTLDSLIRGKEISAPSELEPAEALLDEAESDRADSASVAIEAAAQSAASGLADALPRAGAAGPGYLVINAASNVIRFGLEPERLAELPAAGRPIYATGQSHGRKHAVVDVPPLGFLWLASPAHPVRPERLKEPLAEDAVLRNEYFELLFGRDTGTLRSMHQYGKRGNRLSQQIAYRLGSSERGAADDHESDAYSVMAADSLEITASSPALGELTSRGRLLSRSGEVLAKFTQRYQLWRGSRVLWVDVELETLVEPKADPWNSYYCLRFAWVDEAGGLYRAVNQVRQGANARRLEAPLYFEIEGAEHRTCILTGGLPFHRRIGQRTLDSLLIVRGEPRRAFRVGIGLDVSHPLHEAMALICPPRAQYADLPPPAPHASAWLFHLDAKNVTATHWRPLVEAGRTVGFAARLLETAGRPARLAISALRPIATARRLDFLGAAGPELKVDGGKAVVELTAGEFVHIEARW